MTHILLTGAGFSRNWGGLLASDVLGYLLGCKELNEATRRLLLQKRNFEDVLADLQRATDPEGKKRCQDLISALAGMFNGMGLAFMQKQFEFASQPDVRYSLNTFLSRFDAIYTLNQDTLLEQKYLSFVTPGGRWSGANLPGMKYINPQAMTGTPYDKIAVREPNPAAFSTSPGVQPYIKLHGSANWVESSMGSRILIMGGEKAVSIGQFPILSWYHDEFRKALLQPGARLMVIGYSFSDHHINEAIIQGITSSDLQIYLVDPGGMDVLDKRDRRALIPDHPGPLLDTVPTRLIGISTRLISDTFNEDIVEINNLGRFFTS
jgi:hypothetical protein